MTYIWAYLAGMLTLLNPCVLPLLPIILAAALQSSRFGPIMLTSGLTFAFTAVGVGITAFGHSLGIDEETINGAAAVVMILFGLALLIPRAQTLLAALVSPLASGADRRVERVQDAGLGGQFVVGILLGAVWSPCIGPTLGGAIGLAASGDGLVEAGFHHVRVRHRRVHRLDRACLWLTRGAWVSSGKIGAVDAVGQTHHGRRLAGGWPRHLLAPRSDRYWLAPRRDARVAAGLVGGAVDGGRVSRCNKSLRPLRFIGTRNRYRAMALDNTERYPNASSRYPASATASQRSRNAGWPPL